MDLSFASPHWLWGLLVLPVLALFEWRAMTRSRRALEQLVGPRTPHVLLAQSLPGERRTGALLRLAALALLATAAAGPQWGRETVRRPARGSDLVFVMDVSASMDARDVAPSRMDEARREALALLDRIEGSRVGVLVFAGDAVRLCPLTLDHAAARLTLETISSGSVSTPGTDLGHALENALQMLPAGKRDDQAVVVWTDGEDLEGHASKLVDRLRGTGVRIFAVGVGTPGGDVIPVLDDQGRAVAVKKDESGGIIRSQLDERLLRDLARATRGGYFAASRPGGELPRLSVALGSLARTQRGAHLIERPVSRFPWLALLAAGLLVFERARTRRRVPDRARTGAAGTGARAAAVLLAVALPLAGLLAPRPAQGQSAWARGDAAFQHGQWANAESLYAQRARRGGPAPVQVNLATARARQGKPQESWAGVLARLGETAGRAGQAARYNLGTLFGEQKDYDRALQELRRALERDGNDADARWNYELLSREREQERRKQEQKKQDPKQEKSQPKPDEQGQQGPSKPGAQGPPPPQGSPGGGAQQPAAGQAPPQSTGGSTAGMTPQQAEQLLGSLQELERLERQRARRTKVTGERKGKDW
jgi:Ca-activated chloride channel homolog